MRHLLFLLIFVSLSFDAGAQSGTDKLLPLEDALKDEDLKKAYDFLNDKIWTIHRFCLDDTCTGIPNHTDSSYCFFTSWNAGQDGGDVFIYAYLQDCGYRITEEEKDAELRFFSCGPWIEIKKRKNYDLPVYIIEHARVDKYTMEMTLLDNGRFIIQGPAMDIGKDTQLTEYKIAKPTKEAAESIRRYLK